MLSIDMDSLWSDDIELIDKGVKECICNIEYYINLHNSDRAYFRKLCNDIRTVCKLWSGKTYLGYKKDKPVETVYQEFFTNLMKLLTKCSISNISYEKKYAKRVLFRGTVYRYLGNGESTTQGKVIPIYNEIYVSWSKNPKSNDIKRKLYGTITWLSCNIAEPFYGIDLENIGASKASEREVVFPTIEKCVKEIKYINGDDDDQT